MRALMTAPGLITILTGALLIGFAFGRFSAGGSVVDAAVRTAGTPEAEATATRAAELLELEQLRTQVAGSPVAVACTTVATSTPELSPTPTPTATVVPPAAVGQPMPYAGDWTVVVTGMTLMPTFGDLTPEAGVFAKVTLTMTNNTGDRLRFPYDDLVLLDKDGRTFLPARGSKLVPEVGWFNRLDPSIPTDGFV